MDKSVVSTIKVVLTALAIVFCLYLIYFLGPILVSLTVAFLFVLALESPVKFFMQHTFMNKPIPRGMAVGLTFFLFIAAILFVLTVGLPPVISQGQKLILNLSLYIQRLPGLEEVDLTLKNLTLQLPAISGNVVDVTYSLFSNLFAVVSVLFLTLYISLDWENIKRRFLSLFSGRVKDEVALTFGEIELNVGNWVKGQLTLMLAVGAATFLGLLVLGIDFPLALGLVAGLMEIVPVLGPFVTAVLIAIVGFAASPIKGAAAIVLAILIQQLENNFLVPKVMQKVSGFSPLVILLALLIGHRFFGAVGAVIAVPLTMVFVVVVKRFIRYSPR